MTTEATFFRLRRSSSDCSARLARQVLAVFWLPARFAAPISDLAAGLFVGITRFCTP
nr:MAG TPA: hypothetical protein [Caudoviricetes sp.]